MSSLRIRLTLWYVLLVFLTLAGFSAIVYVGVGRSLNGHLDRSLAQAAQKLIQESELEDDHTLDLETDVLARGERVAAYDRSGQLIAGYGGPPGPGGPHQPDGIDRYQSGGESWRRLTVDAPQLGVRLQISRSETDYRGFLRNLWLFLLAAVPLTSAAAGAGGLFLAARSLNPIDEITRTAAALGADQLSRRLTRLPGDDELSRLSATFNAMLDRLEAAFERQKQFTSDAAHELRTPLALLRTRAEVTLERPRTAYEYRDALTEIGQGTEQMSALLGKLLALARADAGAMPLELERLELAELVEDTCAAAAALRTEGPLTTRLQAVAVRGDQTRLTEVLWNLLDNAMRHSPPGSPIEIELERSGDQAVLRVRDHGPGVAPEHRERIFERFYRVDRVRTPSLQHEQHSGLGLAICRAVAHQHGGSIEVQSRPGEGATFTLRLPAL